MISLTNRVQREQSNNMNDEACKVLLCINTLGLFLEYVRSLFEFVLNVRKCLFRKIAFGYEQISHFVPFGPHYDEAVSA